MPQLPSNGAHPWVLDAEERLFAIASALRYLPLAPATKHLHLRALALKREVKSWRDRWPEDPSPTLDAITSLARDVEAARGSPLMSTAV